MEETVTLWPLGGFYRGVEVDTYLGWKIVSKLTFYNPETGEIVLETDEIKAPQELVLTAYGTPELDKGVVIPVKLKKGKDVDLNSSVAFWLPNKHWSEKKISKCYLYVPMVPEISLEEAFRKPYSFNTSTHDNVAYKLLVVGVYVATLWTRDNQRQTPENRLNVALRALSDKYEIYSGRSGSKIEIGELDKLLAMAEEAKALKDKLLELVAEGDTPIEEGEEDAE